MKQILNKENEKYARKCFEEAINMGVNFKLENKVREKIFSKESMEELLKLPISESTPEDVLNDFNENITSDDDIIDFWYGGGLHESSY